MRKLFSELLDKQGDTCYHRIVDILYGETKGGIFMTSVPELIDVHDLQSQFGLSRSMAYQLLSRRDLPVVVIGRRRFMHRDLFALWLAEQASGQGATSAGGER